MHAEDLTKKAPAVEKGRRAVAKTHRETPEGNGMEADLEKSIEELKERPMGP